MIIIYYKQKMFYYFIQKFRIKIQNFYTVM